VVPTVAVLIVAGLHEPVKLFNEVPGSGGALLFWHSGPIGAKVGVTCAVTVTEMEAVVAHASVDVNI
jgi:hypothetical protein